MLSLPSVAEPLLSRFSIGFTKPTFQRATVLFVGFILTLGRRTVTRVLHTMQGLCPGHFSDYHRVFSRAPWLYWQLARVHAAIILELIPLDQPVVLPVDDTAAQHKGGLVYGKCRHRDACRSTRTFTAWVWGHRWVVLAVNVKFPFATRPWALPVLAALYLGRKYNETRGHRHRTAIELAMPLIAKLIRWFPDRKFIVLGDGGYASHGLARFCHKRRRQLTLVSLLHPRAHLCDAPVAPKKGQMGRRRVRGAKLPHPEQTVAGVKRRERTTVDWYGGKCRKVSIVSSKAHWYKATEGLVPISWVHVHDLEGTHEDRYFYSTDPTMDPRTIIGLYTARWSIEVTFQEVRQHLGFATPRNWTKKSVLRTVPFLLGLFSIVSVLYHKHACAKGRTPKPPTYPWYAKAEITFSDALTTVRRLFWAETVFSEALPHGDLNKLPPKLREMLFDHLATAA
jgi:hypothetical protein